MKQLVDMKIQLKVNNNSIYKKAKSILVITLCLLLEQSYALNDLERLGRGLGRALGDVASGGQNGRDRDRAREQAKQAQIAQETENQKKLLNQKVSQTKETLEQSRLSQSIINRSKTNLKMAQLMIEMSHKNIENLGVLLRENQLSSSAYQQLVGMQYEDLNQWIGKFEKVMTTTTDETEKKAVEGFVALKKKVAAYQRQLKAMSESERAEGQDPLENLVKVTSDLKALIRAEHQRLDKDLKAEVGRYEAKLRELARLEGTEVKP